MKEENPCFYTTHKKLPLNLELAPNSWVISVIVSINFMLYFQQKRIISLLSEDNKDKNITTKEI
jgi:hypothetical protein